MITTRSGRNIKKPDRYVPVEQVIDDYNDSDYDSNSNSDSDSDSDSGSDTTLGSEEDEYGNLKDFVTYEEEEEKEKRKKKTVNLRV